MTGGQPVQIELKFDANAVAAPAQLAAREADELVTFALNAVEDTDLTEKPEARLKGTMYAQLGDGGLTAETRKEAYRNWILNRGLLEIARGTKASLEEAMLYIKVTKFVGRTMTAAQFDNEIASIRKRANKDNFRQLLTKVNTELAEPLSFSKEFDSLNKVRNILEHRGGIVGAQDAEGAQSLDLTLPRLALFYVANGEEKELQIGQRVEQETEIYIKRVSRIKTFVVGERITFNASEFNEIAFACHMFAADLAAKLPKIEEPAS